MSLDFPDLDYVGLGKVTRKVLDRLAPFCYMKEVPSDRTNSTSSDPKTSTSPLGSPLSSPEVSPSPSISGLPPLDDPALPNPASSPSSSTAKPPRTGPQTQRHSHSRLVEKIKTRVLKFVGAIDAHVHSAQVAFKMCREGMVLCDEDVRLGKVDGAGVTEQTSEQGHSSGNHTQSKQQQQPTPPSGGNKSELGGGGGGEEEGWDVDIDPDESDPRGVAAPANEHHAYGTSGHHFLLHHAHEGLELARKTEETFDAVQQEVYKIAAQTKDRSGAVMVPSAPGQEPTIRKHLKEVGLDLVANLTLLESGFGRQVKETVAWWRWVIADLEKGEESSLFPLVDSKSVGGGRDPEAMKKAYEWWERAKEGWQAYYDVIATLHIVYHDLILTSARAWDGTTVVVKPHQGSDENLAPKSKPHTRNVSKGSAGDNDDEFERESVPQRVDSSNEQQDGGVAGCMRVTGFLTWGRAYSQSKPAKGKATGGEHGAKGVERRKGSLNLWARPWKSASAPEAKAAHADGEEGQQVKQESSQAGPSAPAAAPTLQSRASSFLKGRFRRRIGQHAA